MDNVIDLLPENVRKSENLPAHQMQQHLYPRIAINDPGEDGEITFRLILGLPCCGVDADIECPPTLTIAELGKILKAFSLFHHQIKALPTFQVCAVDLRNKAA